MASSLARDNYIGLPPGASDQLTPTLLGLVSSLLLVEAEPACPSPPRVSNNRGPGAAVQGKEWLCYRRRARQGTPPSHSRPFSSSLVSGLMVQDPSSSRTGLHPLSVFSIGTQVLLPSLGWSYFSLLLCGQELTVTCPDVWMLGRALAKTSS